MGLGRICRQRRAVNGEAVVHGGDLDLAGDEVLHRMIGAVMALVHFHGLGADRDAEHLMAETDAKSWHALVDDVADHRHRVRAGRRRIARAVREKDAVGLERKNVLARGLRRHHGHAAAFACELAQDIALDAVVERDHVKARPLLAAIALAPPPRRLVPGEALARGHHRHEIHADEARPFARFLLEGIEIEPARGLVRNHRVGHALEANSAGERARVDAGEADDAARFEPLVEMASRAVIRRRRDGGVQHDAARPRRRRHVHRLDVVLVGADIADMRECEGDDLPGIGGIGEDLLVAGHRRVEADFTHCMPGCAKTRAFEDRAVGEHEQRAGLWLGPNCFGLILAGMGRLFLAHRKPKSWSAPPGSFGSIPTRARFCERP